MEFTEWIAYNNIDPFGELRADLRQAQICALTANINRDRKKHKKPFGLADFMPYLDKEEKPKPDQSPGQQVQVVSSMASLGLGKMNKDNE